MGLKPGHDGAVAYICGDVLEFSYEGEKDNRPRYSEATPEILIKAFASCKEIPDAIAYGGWSISAEANGQPVAAGYRGLELGISMPGEFAGKHILNFSSSHERSHLLCAYGLSPFEQGQPCYALVWEGHIGSIYFINEKVEITKLCDVLNDPGIRYAFLYALADPTFKMPKGSIRLSDAGKLMAIAAFSQKNSVDPDAHEVVNRILDCKIDAKSLSKNDFVHSRYHNCGVTDPGFADLAKLFSDRIFQIFEHAIKEKVSAKLPLLISGGCGLNCEWNTRFVESGIFSKVFIPPCANDSGSAIGTAVDAKLHITGNAKIRWSVYAGEPPIADCDIPPEFEEFSYDPIQVADLLRTEKILGWVRGRYEIGPRSLGARSILASPASPTMLTRLNRIKRRENFRPIAPVCLEEDMADYFYPATPSPYMLEFRSVITNRIPAVTHVDGSARPQSVTKEQNPELYELLRDFKNLSGLSVLCNTSLNFNGNGFLNRPSEICKFSLQHDLDGFVFENRLLLKK